MASHSEQVAEKALSAALADPVKAASLQKSPSAYFKSQGIEIPGGREADFDQFFLTKHARVVSHAALHAKAGQLPEDAVHELQALAFPSFKCAACSVGAYSVAALIVAVGVAGLASLTVASGPVVALAAFAGVSEGVALAFIVTLGAAVAKGVAAVVEAICDWTGAC